MMWGLQLEMNTMRRFNLFYDYTYQRAWVVKVWLILRASKIVHVRRYRSTRRKSPAWSDKLQRRFIEMESVKFRLCGERNERSADDKYRNKHHDCLTDL